MECSGDDNTVYFWKLGNKPKAQFDKVYIIVGGKVRWSATCIGYSYNSSVKLNDGRTLYAKCFMVLVDFKRLRRPYESKKGFQGFRYRN